MDDNKKKFVNNIVKHIKAFTTAEEEAPIQEDAPAAPEPARPDKVPVEPVNSEDQIKNTAGKPLKIRGSAASAGEKDSVLSRLAVLLSERAVLGGVILYAVYIVNLIGMAVFTRRFALGLTQALLYKFHIDTISFSSITFLEISILVSYIFSFIFGGLVLFALLRIGYLISDLCGLAYSHKLTRWLLFLFMAVFAVVSLCFLLSGNPVLSLSVYNWAAPLFTCGGGLSMYCMSLRHIEID